MGEAGEWAGQPQRVRGADEGLDGAARDEACIAFSGDLDFDAPDEIRYIYNEKLSYLFP